MSPRSFQPATFSPLFAAALAAALVFALPQPAAACSCMAPPPPAEALEGADSVFSGTVLSVTTAERDLGSMGRLTERRVVVELERVWKGCEVAEGEERPRRVELTTGMGAGDCGYDFNEGERYLVYAYEGRDDALTTGICSRTANLENAADDLAALGDPAWVAEGD